MPIENLEKGSALVSVLLLVGITGIIYAYTEKNVNNGIYEQKINLASINQNDLEKKAGTLCSSLYAVKKGAAKAGVYKSPEVLNCTSKNAQCKAVANPDLNDPNIHDGYPIHLFSSDENTRQVGSKNCPAFYTVYGSPTSKGGELGRCEPKKLDAFAIYGSVSPICSSNTSTCDAAAALKVKCVVKRLESDYGRSKDNSGARVAKYSVKNYDITGFMCPNTYSTDPGTGKPIKQAVVGIDANGQFECAPMISVIGPKGEKGPTTKGDVGDKGPDGVVNVSIRGDGCFAEDTLIWTDQGQMAIQNIDGDEKIWNPVTKKYNSIRSIVAGPEKYPMIKFTIDGLEVTVTRYHPMNTVDGDMQAYQIKVGDLLGTNDGFKKVQSIEKIVPTVATKVFNIEIWGDSDDSSHHQIVANGIITGDLFVQKQLKSKLKFEQMNNEVFSALNYDVLP